MNRKTIGLPHLHDLDIAPILPIVDSPPFQRLRHLQQLGPAALVFPDGNHSRFFHSLATFSLTLERTKVWIQDGIITKEEAWQLALHGLLHDIGHSVYSHATEALCPRDHNQQGILRLEELRTKIEKCGGNVKIIGELMAHRHQLHPCVSHRPLGTDKLAYLFIDSKHTTEAVSFRMGDLLNHVSFRNGKIVIDSSIIAEAMQLNEAYVYMYTHVYCEKGALIAQAFMQQIVHYAITEGCVQPNQLAYLGEDEVNAALIHAQGTVGQELYVRYKERKMPKTAFGIWPQEAPLLNKRRNKAKGIGMSVVPVKEFSRFSHLKDPNTARKVETTIAKIVDLPAHEVLIVPDVPLDRFIPHAPEIMDSGQLCGTLQDHYPAHYGGLMERMVGAIRMRVCVPERHRERVGKPDITKKIFELLVSH